MEQDKTKRAREGDGANRKENNRNAKKRDLCGTKLMKDGEKEEFGYGVFDFPWLKDGVISKSEDYLVGFEDSFSTLLQQEDTFKAATNDLSKAHGLCETPKACMANVPEAKLEDLPKKPFEAEDVDTIWNSFINQHI